MRRTLGASIVIVILLVATTGAQDSRAPASVERLRQALQGSSSTLAPTSRSPLWLLTDETRRLGILTLTPPKTNGEFVSVVVPVGELASRAVHVFARAQRRHAEMRAHAEVMRALENFQQQRVK